MVAARLCWPSNCTAEGGPWLSPTSLSLQARGAALLRDYHQETSGRDRDAPLPRPLARAAEQAEAERHQRPCRWFGNGCGSRAGSGTE